MLQLIQTVRQQQHQQQNQGELPSQQQQQDAEGGSAELQAGVTQLPAEPPPPQQRRVSFAADTRGGSGEDVDGGGAEMPPPPPPLAAGLPRLRMEPRRSEAAAAAAVAAAVAAAALPTATARSPVMQQGGDPAGNVADGAGGSGPGGDEDASKSEPEAPPPPPPLRRQQRHLTEAMIRTLNARVAGELIHPRPPAPDPFGDLDHGEHLGGEGPVTPSAARARAILATMGGTKMDISELRTDPRVSAVDQLLAPPASSLLALLYLASRQPVPHPEDFLTGTDLQYYNGASAGAYGGGAAVGAVSPLSGRPPAGDLFMDFGSPGRALHGQTYRHVEAWSVRDAGLVLERQAREMELAGRYRMPAAYIEADKALGERLNLDDPDLEDRADELRERLRREAYDEVLLQAGEELREAERERYGYVRSAPMREPNAAAAVGEEEGEEQEGRGRG
ncbi:hypothetical protein VOLCADRAFT_87905 [Volvox carteri f. nagariensis]|uniref:Uncharacterized protein n=1 Tax=Volvox carteri f. nagariensis TaxID=3068 RepID=D8TMJ6_VOLCA|nr:uncharacterized protein VOLCADRAFT_87905 [Volvox carteri f. nagariensis]EFJ51135.1 hypothetical protein VOLCADRAFT_87905 [Volvox carteri f. nagariensis]|eukprot:XP_002947602.1 hypothetical protein VOLCADRAFT_87905 [Volvox carteri f. nagariensis]